MDFVAHTHEQQEEPLLPLTQGGREADLICGHIQSLKDVVELKLTLNPLFTTKLPTSLSTSKDHPIQMGGRTSSSSFMAPFLCPISQLELNGKHPCSYLRPCGHVMADLVWKEMGRRDKKIKKRNKTEGTTTEPTTVEEESQECPVCGQPWVQRVSLYPQHSP
ncbi:hypothetical protein HMI56_005637 [Coelomomyces lativittatus]|nr:hypothetical protein HMI56_005637 [Coelomomyces lativittatus]